MPECAFLAEIPAGQHRVRLRRSPQKGEHGLEKYMDTPQNLFQQTIPPRPPLLSTVSRRLFRPKSRADAVHSPPGFTVSVFWDGTIPRRREGAVSRRSERAASVLTATVRRRWRTYAVQAVNIGEAGMAILSATRFQVGDELTVTFSLPNHEAPIKATAIVRHNTGYVHGLEFWTMTEHDRIAVARYVAERTNSSNSCSDNPEAPSRPAV
jgi:PilZ domain